MTRGLWGKIVGATSHPSTYQGVELQYQGGWAPNFLELIRLFVMFIGCGAFITTALGGILFAGFFGALAAIIADAVLGAFIGVALGYWAYWVTFRYQNGGPVKDLIRGAIAGAVAGAILGILPSIIFFWHVNPRVENIALIEQWLGALGVGLVGAILVFIALHQDASNNYDGPGTVAVVLCFCSIPFAIGGGIAGNLVTHLTDGTMYQLSDVPDSIAAALFSPPPAGLLGKLFISAKYGAVGGLIAWSIRVMIPFFSKKEYSVELEATFPCIVPPATRGLIRKLEEDFEVRLVAKVRHWLAPNSIHPLRAPETTFLVIVRQGSYMWLAATVSDMSTKPQVPGLSEEWLS